MKQLLQTLQSYRIIIGARNTERTESAYNTIAYNHQNSSVVILPLELSDLKQVQIFAHRALEVLDQGKIDYLLLNAAIHGTADGPGSHGSQWCEPYIVNHLCMLRRYPSPSITVNIFAAQHYLLHLLQDHLVKSQSRIVVVSSGAIRLVPDDLGKFASLICSQLAKLIMITTSSHSFNNPQSWRRHQYAADILHHQVYSTSQRSLVASSTLRFLRGRRGLSRPGPRHRSHGKT